MSDCWAKGRIDSQNKGENHRNKFLSHKFFLNIRKLPFNAKEFTTCFLQNSALSLNIFINSKNLNPTQIAARNNQNHKNFQQLI